MSCSNLSRTLHTFNCNLSAFNTYFDVLSLPHFVSMYHMSWNGRDTLSTYICMHKCVVYSRRRDGNQETSSVPFNANKHSTRNRKSAIVIRSINSQTLFATHVRKEFPEKRRRLGEASRKCAHLVHICMFETYLMRIHIDKTDRHHAIICVGSALHQRVRRHENA